jgi:transposase
LISAIAGIIVALMDKKAATEAAIKRQYEQISDELDERARRLWAASEARKVGWGGVTRVAKATGLARSTIYVGLAELDTKRAEPASPRTRRVRSPGGGRKAIKDESPEILDALEGLVEPETRGDPESPLRWTLKSLRRLAKELGQLGFRVSYWTVGRLLRGLGYSLQANQKVREGGGHQDRDAQFRYLNARVQAQHATHNPAISVDTKKKELVGDFKNPGRELRPKGQPEPVQVHDFPDPARPKAVPYGVYDMGANEAWVSVGISHDTASFAAATIQRWWWEMGEERYPDATELLITADCGGSNGYRLRLWKLELQHLANALGFPVTVCHLPPGTSKWNKIEHRLFSFLSINWRGKPLVSYAAIVNLIAATKTEKGLEVRAVLDETNYPKGRKVDDETMGHINLLKHDFHGEWNYTVYPSDVDRPDRYSAETPK